MTRPLRLPDLEIALSSAPHGMASAVTQASAALMRLDIRHAVCGGFAAACFGARPTYRREVKLIVGDEAFVHHGALVSARAGVPVRVSNVAVRCAPLPLELALLDEQLGAAPRTGGVPVLPCDALIATMLVGGRLQDQADIVALLNAGAIDVAVCRVWLAAHGFEARLPLFDALVPKAGE